MGLNGDDAEAAANLRNITDGSNASQQRKHKENSVFIESARLNWIGNGHPLYQHLKMQAMCTLSGNCGDYDRFTPITSRPVKAIKAADGYDEMMRSAKDDRVMALLQTTLRCILLDHLHGTEVRCERAAEQHEDLAGAGMDGGPAVTAKYRPASVTIDNNNTQEDTRDPSDPGYHYEKVQVGYTFTRGAWRCYMYAARHTHHENEGFEQLNKSGLSNKNSATLELKSAGKTARWSLGIQALRTWLPRVIAEFAPGPGGHGGGMYTLPPKPADFELGKYAQRVFDKALGIGSRTSSARLTPRPLALKQMSSSTATTKC
jgi:hypothetical protein